MRKIILPSLGTALIITMMTSQLFAQGVPVPKSDNNPNPPEQVKTIFSFKSEIGFTDEQEVKLKALLYDEQTAMDADNNALKGLGTELNDMVNKKADMPAIKSKLEEISKIQVGISYRSIEDGRKLEAILTPAQLAKWAGIQKSFRK